MKKTLVLGTAMAAAMLLLTGCETDRSMYTVYGPVVRDEDDWNNQHGNMKPEVDDDYDEPVMDLYGPLPTEPLFDDGRSV